MKLVTVTLYIVVYHMGKKCWSQNRWVGLCVIPLTPLLPVLHCHKCYTESRESDVTCGWLNCSLHHLWIHPLKHKSNCIKSSLKEPFACFNNQLTYSSILCHSTVSVFSKHIMSSLATLSLCFALRDGTEWSHLAHSHSINWVSLPCIISALRTQGGNREMCGSPCFKARVYIWKPTKSKQNQQVRI